MRTLEVYLGEKRIGRVTETRKGGRFAYDPAIVERFAEMPLLSLSLPVKARPFSEGRTSAWFNGLLPEGPRRDAIAKSLGFPSHDWVGLLSKIGWECAGAVRLFETSSKTLDIQGYESLKADALREKLVFASARMPSTQNDCFRMSLGGFQDKICVAMPKLPLDVSEYRVEAVALPLGSAPSTHILKPENAKSYPGSAESEAWAMTAASYAARCSRVALLYTGNAPDTLVVERYDREGTWPEGIVRVHQEDACQALGLPSDHKYANAREPKGDDPSYKGIADLMMRYAEEPLRELRELLRQMTVNIVLGNWDAHAKNVSFLYKKPFAPVLAPLYDVVPIAEVEPRTGVLSMRIDGHIKPSEIDRVAVIREGMNWGISADDADLVIDKCLEGLERGIYESSDMYPKAADRHSAYALARIEKLRHY